MTQEGTRSATAAATGPARRSSSTRSSARHFPSDANAHAHTIVDAVIQAWWSAYGGSSLEVPLSTVAALALTVPRDPDGPDLADQILAWPTDKFDAFLRGVWTMFVRVRPDLWPRVHSLAAWLWSNPSATQVRAARAVAEAALRAGQLHLTGDRDRVCEVDLFGILWQDLCSRGSRKGTGQFFTPGCVTQLLGRLCPPEEHSSFHEPAVGTGGIVLGAARAMRELGRDPATVLWFCCDIDPTVAALCAVNTHIWGLPRVLVGVGDALLDDWLDRAVAEREMAVKTAQMTTSLNEARSALALLGACTPPGTPPPGAAETPAANADGGPAATPDVA
jgi:hypothetical protein